MKTSFGEYIVNPMGNKNSVWTHRQMYEKMYTEKLDKILLREAGKIKYFLYFSKNENVYVVHMKIPSEVVDKFYYDTIIKFEDGKGDSRTLQNYNVQFYSNDPRFVFTFAYVFKKNDMFIEEMTKKMSSKALKDRPKETNPTLEVGYVKSIYFAYILMTRYRLFDKIYFETYGKSASVKDIFKEIISNTEDADKKVEDRKRLGEEIEKSKKNKEHPVKTVSSTQHTPSQSLWSVPFTQSTTKTGISKVTSAVSKVKTIGKIKRK